MRDGATAVARLAMDSVTREPAELMTRPRSRLQGGPERGDAGVTGRARQW